MAKFSKPFTFKFFKYSFVRFQVPQLSKSPEVVRKKLLNAVCLLHLNIILSFKCHELGTYVRQQNQKKARQFMKIYYEYRIPPRCFDHLCGHPQGGTLQNILCTYFKPCIFKTQYIASVRFTNVCYISMHPSFITYLSEDGNMSGRNTYEVG